MSRFGAFVAFVLFLSLNTTGWSATAVWSGAANNRWDTTSGNWTRGGTPNSAYVDGDTVVFDDSATVTNINIYQTVSPGAVLITNSTARTYTFTNQVIAGAGSVTKDGSGTVYFGNSVSAANYYTNSFTFSGGTVVSNGALKFLVGTNAAYSYATGGSPYGFGSGSIRLDGALATLGFSAGFSVSATVVLTNDLVIGPNGGIAMLAKFGSSNPQHNLNGNISLYGNFAITNNGNIGNGLSGAVWRVLSPGVTRLYANCRITAEGASAAGGTHGIWSQNILEDSAPVQLTIAGGTEVEPIDFTGDNTGVTGGVVVDRNGTLDSGPVVFSRTNAMGVGTFTIRSNAYAGLAFPFTAGLVNAIVYEDSATLGIDSNSSVNIDLAAIGKDIWLGSANGATYTGTLTPYGSTYKLAGAGTKDYYPLVFANTNALTGARMLMVGGPTNSMQVPGAVALAAPNDYTGGTEITGNKRAKTGSIGDSRLVVRSDGALGSGPITMRQLGTGGPGLYFETPLPYVLTNSLILTGSTSAAYFSTTNKLTFRCDLTVLGSNSMNICQLNVGQPLTVFDMAASGKTVSFATGGRINQEQGLFDPVSTANFPTNIGYRQNSGGTLLLSPGFTWNDFVTGRSGVNSSSPGAGSYQAKAFAARGTTQIIDESGPFALDRTYSPWLVGPGLGSDVKDSDGSYYANAPIKITRNIITTNNLFTVTVAATGPGHTNNSTVGVCHEFAGNISGIGVVNLSYRASVTPNIGLLPELVFSGTNTWTGNYNGDYGSTTHFMSGPGGMGMVAASPYGMIRFDGVASLPTGNGGQPSYLMALGRSTSKGNIGYYLTGGATERFYSLPPGYKFLLGGGDNTSALLGAALGRATLTGTTVYVMLANTWGTANSTNQFFQFSVRDPASVFTLGSAEAPVKLCNVYSAGNTVGVGWYDAASNATAMSDRPGSFTRVDKYGAGTLVLSNLQYVLMDGTTDNSSQFTWQLGSDVKSRFFEGVVRETGTGTSNSLRNFKFSMKGAIYGLASNWTPTVGTNAGQCNAESSDSAPWGFSAYGGNRTVDLRPSSGTLLRYGQTAASASFFIYDGVLLTLNAADAEGELTMGASDIEIDLSATTVKNREILVWSTNYAARIPCLIKNSSGVGGLIKNGPGRLILSSTTNTYNGPTAVSNGTLTLNGVLTASTNAVTVYSGATLEGTGTVNRVVSVANGGTLSSGPGSGLVGSLTVSSNMLLATGGTLSVDLTAGGNDVVNVLGTGTIDVTGCSLNVVVASGYTPPGGNIAILNAPNGTITGTFSSITRGYQVVISGDGKTLYVKKNSPGFIFRAQ